MKNQPNDKPSEIKLPYTSWIWFPRMNIEPFQNETEPKLYPHAYVKMVDISILEQAIDIIKKQDEALKENAESFMLGAGLASSVRDKIYGNRYDCDCEGGCSCKPKNLIALEEIKYHLLGSDIQTDEAITETKEALEKMEIKWD